MNNRIPQTCCIVMSARKALMEGKDMKPVNDEYIVANRFVFMTGVHKNEIRECDSVVKWFEECKHNNIKDIQYTIVISEDDEMELRLVCPSYGAIVCCWGNEVTTVFCPSLEYSPEQQGWIITYKEKVQVCPSVSSEYYTDKRFEFIDVLKRAKKLAADINALDFVPCFQKAYEVLTTNKAIAEGAFPDCIPRKYTTLLWANIIADVFGAMGSWNDEPRGCAQEKGMMQQYDELSDELLMMLRYNLLFITNTSWK